MRNKIPILVILFLSSIGLAATGDSNDPIYTVVHSSQWAPLNSQLSSIADNQQSIIAAQQQFSTDALFLLQTIAIVDGLCWGAITWGLILKAKSSKRFW